MDLYNLSCLLIFVHLNILLPSTLSSWVASPPLLYCQSRTKSIVRLLIEEWNLQSTLLLARAQNPLSTTHSFAIAQHMTSLSHPVRNRLLALSLSLCRARSWPRLKTPTTLPSLPCKEKGDSNQMKCQISQRRHLHHCLQENHSSLSLHIWEDRQTIMGSGTVKEGERETNHDQNLTSPLSPSVN